MALTLQPNTPQVAVVGQPLCFEGSGIMSIPQEDQRALNLPASGATWTYNASTKVFKKTSGTNGSYVDGFVLTDETVYGKQPFHFQCSNVVFSTPGGSTNNHSSYIKAIDDQGNQYTFEVAKYCNATPGNCSSNWYIKIYINGGSVYTRTVNLNENFRIVSDGNSLIFAWQTAGNWNNLYVMTLPVTALWRFELGNAYINNEVLAVIFKGTYQGAVPITWSAPLGGTLNGNPSRQCFTSAIAGDYSVCIDSEFDDILCVPVHVSALEFEPVGFDCGGCVFTNEIVHFTSNGGLGGTLTVLDDDDNPVGTVIDALTWQAPGGPVHVTATYTLGEDYLECELNVIPPFEVVNIEGDTILGLAPGETIHLETNYEYMGGTVTWQSLDCPNIVTPDGYLTIPRHFTNDCFGSLDCYIRATVTLFPNGVECSNFDPDTDDALTLDIRVIVDPVFPTPDLGGPKWVKWKPETPDFRVITKTMEGGCAETHIRNRVPIQRWKVDYSGLRYENDNPCDPGPCCDDPLGFTGGIDPNSLNAKMLDDFWMLVAGQYGFFTLIDPKTGYIWRRVRFEGTMERDHINWRTIHSRSFTLIWNPCCATEPAGGACPHNTVREDPYPPSTPTDLAVEALSYSELRVTWGRSYDNVGIKRYEISADQGVPIELGGNSLSYVHSRLAPTSTHAYRVRAIDSSNNPSPWTDEILGTTLDRDVTPPSIPTGFSGTGYGTAFDGSTIQYTWNANPEEEEVAGYKIIVNGYIYDISEGVGYTAAGLPDCRPIDAYIRAYDIHGLASRWSPVLRITTPCGQIFEGSDEVLEGAEIIIENSKIIVATED